MKILPKAFNPVFGVAFLAVAWGLVAGDAVDAGEKPFNTNVYLAAGCFGFLAIVALFERWLPPLLLLFLAFLAGTCFFSTMASLALGQLFPAFAHRLEILLPIGAVATFIYARFDQLRALAQPLDLTQKRRGIPPADDRIKSASESRGNARRDRR